MHKKRNWLILAVVITLFFTTFSIHYVIQRKEDIETSFYFEENDYVIYVINDLFLYKIGRLHVIQWEFIVPDFNVRIDVYIVPIENIEQHSVGNESYVTMTNETKISADIFTRTYKGNNFLSHRNF